jgi:tetratricopeptide (TPR) repeat protein
VALAESISAQGGEYEFWDDRTRTDYTNLHAVLEWCRTADPGGVPEAVLGMRLAKALRLYWDGFAMREGLYWLRELCSPMWLHGPTHLRARLLNQFGHILMFSHNPDDNAQAMAVLEEGVAVSREIGDQAALAEACRHCGEFADFRANDIAAAERWFVESLVAGRAAGSPWNIAWTLLDLGLVAINKGDDQQAAQLYEECLSIFRGLGYPMGVSRTMGHYSGVLLRLGKIDQAATALDTTLDMLRHDLSLVEIMELHDHRGEVAYAQAEFWQALHLFCQTLRFVQEHLQQFSNTSDQMLLRNVLSEIAVVATALGRYVGATHLFCFLPKRFYYYNRPNLVQAQIGASMAACRTALGDEAFDVAWAVGQALTLEQAIAEALEIETTAIDS